MNNWEHRNMYARPVVGGLMTYHSSRQEHKQTPCAYILDVLLQGCWCKLTRRRRRQTLKQARITICLCRSQFCGNKSNAHYKSKCNVHMWIGPWHYNILWHSALPVYTAGKKEAVSPISLWNPFSNVFWSKRCWHVVVMYKKGQTTSRTRWKKTV